MGKYYATVNPQRNFDFLLTYYLHTLINSRQVCLWTTLIPCRLPLAHCFSMGLVPPGSSTVDHSFPMGSVPSGSSTAHTTTDETHRFSTGSCEPVESSDNLTSPPKKKRRTAMPSIDRNRKSRLVLF